MTAGRTPNGDSIPAEDALRLVLAGQAPSGLRVRGHLSFKGNRELTALPSGLQVDSLDASAMPALRSLPEGLRATRVRASGCATLTSLPAGLRLWELDLSETPLELIPADLRVEFRLDLSRCTRLRSLPEGLSVGTLLLRGCTALEGLPEGLRASFLDVSGCTSLARWPRDAQLVHGALLARGCTGLRGLPEWLREVSQLDLAGCTGIRELPEALTIHSWVDVAGSGLTSLPVAHAGTPIRWRGVPIDARIAFQPETITASEALAERNLERRRVLIERMGNERFLRDAKAEVLDRDVDPGGERQLLKVPLPGDEDLVCVAVTCPSTGRRYVIRVPPAMRTCRQAVAWVAGFDDPAQYRPIAET